MAVFGTTSKTVATTSIKSGFKSSLKSGGKAVKSALPDSLQRGLGFNFKAASKASKANKEILEKALAATVSAKKEAAEALSKRSGTTLSTDFTENTAEASAKNVVTKVTASKVPPPRPQPKIDVFKGPIDLPISNTVKKTGVDAIEDTATAATKSSSNLLRNGAIALGTAGAALGAYVLLNDKQKGKQIGSELNTTSDASNTSKTNNASKASKASKGFNDKQTKTYITIGVILLLIMMLFYLL